MGVYQIPITYIKGLSHRLRGPTFSLLCNERYFLLEMSI